MLRFLLRLINLPRVAIDPTAMTVARPIALTHYSYPVHVKGLPTGRVKTRFFVA